MISIISRATISISPPSGSTSPTGSEPQDPSSDAASALPGDILLQDFAGAPIDLVIDDASHLYGPSRKTFELLFPILRCGGFFILEDWRTDPKVLPYASDVEKAQPPVSELVHEIVELSKNLPGIVQSTRIFSNFAIFERGAAPLEAGFLDPPRLTPAAVLPVLAEPPAPAA